MFKATWTITVGETPEDPPEPQDAFASMEAAIVEGELQEESLSPVLPCQNPYLELTLTDDDGNPLANAKYKLTAPGGENRTGTLDENGFVHLDGIDIAADTCSLRLQIQEDENDPEADPTYEVQVVPKETEPEPAEDEEPGEPEQTEYFHSSLDVRSISPEDGEDDE